jgi:LPXTG-motif cell wall-anchored protein
VTGMKKVIVVAVLFGIILGSTLFFSSLSVTQPPQIMLQNSVLPQGKTGVVPVRESQSVWFTAIGFVLGGIVGFGAFLFAKRRD